MASRTTLPRSSKAAKHIDDSEAARIARIAARTGWRWFDPRHPKKYEMFERISTDLGPKAQSQVEEFEKNRYVFNTAICYCRHVQNRQRELFGESIVHIVNGNMKRIVVENAAFKPRNPLPARVTPKSQLALYSITAEELEGEGEELEKDEQNPTQLSNTNPDHNTQNLQQEAQNTTKYYTHAHSHPLTAPLRQPHIAQDQKSIRARKQEATRKLLQSILSSDAYLKGQELQKPEDSSPSLSTSQKTSSQMSLIRARQLLLSRIGE